MKNLALQRAQQRELATLQTVERLVELLYSDPGTKASGAGAINSDDEAGVTD